VTVSEVVFDPENRVADFSTAHSNRANKVIETPYTFLLVSPVYTESRPCRSPAFGSRTNLRGTVFVSRIGLRAAAFTSRMNLRDAPFASRMHLRDAAHGHSSKSLKSFNPFIFNGFKTLLSNRRPATPLSSIDSRLFPLQWRCIPPLFFPLIRLACAPRAHKMRSFAQQVLCLPHFPYFMGEGVVWPL
jgi:hypothetical protein